MGTHQIRHQILLQTVPLVQPLVLIPESLIDVKMRFAHVVQRLRGAVFRSYLQLSGDMVFDKFRKEFAVFLRQHIVIPDTAADEHFFNAGYGPDLPQQRQIVAVAGVQIFAGRGGQAGPVFAHAVFYLLFAGGVAEICRRSAHIVDIALELRVPDKPLYLPHHAFVASGSDHAALMKSQGAEITPAETAPVVRDRKPHLLNSRHAALGVIHGVDLPDVGQAGYKIQLLPVQRHRRRVYHQRPVSMPL